MQINISILLTMNGLTQAYRTTCIPRVNRLDALDIPSEYIGKELEIIVIPVVREYNDETLAAMQEARDIMSGKIKAKRYKTVAEMNADIDAEDA